MFIKNLLRQKMNVVIGWVYSVLETVTLSNLTLTNAWQNAYGFNKTIESGGFLALRRFTQSLMLALFPL